MGKLRITRNVGEEIVIGDEDIVVTVLGISDSCRQVSLEIDADDRIQVNRREVWERIQEEKNESSGD